MEAYTTAYLLVKTGYRPKTHDLGDFIDFLVELDNSFSTWFDLTDPEEERKYELLKKAYIEARYSYKYIITKEELEFLKNKALFLQEKIIKLCRAEIEKSKSLALT
ncbi:MAG: HEPN domain-containing protein [Candidatus Electrothrix sp. GM3_4]|nr:HEPN domain-containing protein [Candidatus Electrothrix sp. GM3_4]